MCLKTVDKEIKEYPDNIGYKVVAKNRAGSFMGLYQHKIYKLGETYHCRKSKPLCSPFYHTGRDIDRCINCYTPGFHVYKNLEDAKKEVFFISSVTIIKVEYNKVGATGSEWVGEVFSAPVVVAKSIKVLEEVRL